MTGNRQSTTLHTTSRQVSKSLPPGTQQAVAAYMREKQRATSGFYSKSETKAIASADTVQFEPRSQDSQQRSPSAFTSDRYLADDFCVHDDEVTDEELRSLDKSSEEDDTESVELAPELRSDESESEIDARPWNPTRSRCC